MPVREPNHPRSALAKRMNVGTTSGKAVRSSWGSAMAGVFAKSTGNALQSASPSAQPPVHARTSKLKQRLTQAKAFCEEYALVRVLESTAAGIMKDRVFSHAAAMTYYGIFSMFSIVLLSMAVAGLVLQNDDFARAQIMGLITSLLPQGQEQLRKVIVGVIEAKGTAAGVGILTLLYSALVWFQEIDANINEIWGVGKPRSFVKSMLLALGMVAGLGGIAVASFIATAAIHFIARFTGDIPGSVWLWQAVVSLLSVITMAGAFYMLYGYTPQRRVQVADIWPAALATAVLWEATRRLLAFYIEKTDVISGYGSVGAAMALLLWIYVASTIILVGAEFSYATAKERRHIMPDDELKVIAPPGEQPTPKFAPQVGEGFTTGLDQDEPTRAWRPGAPPLNGSPVPYASHAPPALPAAAAAPLDGRLDGSPPGMGTDPFKRRPANRLATLPADAPVPAVLAFGLGFVAGWFSRRS